MAASTKMALCNKFGWHAVRDWQLRNLWTEREIKVV